METVREERSEVDVMSLLDAWADLAKRVIDDPDNERDGQRLDDLVRELDRARVPHRDRWLRLRQERVA